MATRARGGTDAATTALAVALKALRAADRSLGRRQSVAHRRGNFERSDQLAELLTRLNLAANDVREVDAQLKASSS